jgi:integrase
MRSGVPSRRQHGEGSVYKRTGRGHRRDQWVAVADLGWKGGKRDRREFTSTVSLEDALGKRARFLHRRRDGFTLPKGRQPYVSEWVTHWLWNIAKPSIDPNTFYRSYRQKCEDYIIPYFAKTKLAELAEDDIEAWHRHLEATTSRRGTPLSAATITTAHRIFSSALKVAVVRGRLPRNPCSNVPPPKIRRHELELPTADEVQAILAACRERPDGARWIVAMCTGLRQGEVLGLRWRDVRLTKPASVTVRQSAARIGGEVVFKAPKSEKSRRTVPLPSIAAGALKAHREAQQVVDLRDGLVFTGERGQPVHSKTDWKAWADLLDGLGLPHYRVHDLRHGYATMLLERGADPRLVQDLMGWSTARMAEIYQHVRPVLHAQAAAMLDEALGDF